MSDTTFAKSLILDGAKFGIMVASEGGSGKEL